MANGFCPALLEDINNIAGSNAPARKLQIAGFLSMLFCCQDSLASPVNDGLQGGTRRTMTVKYRPRPLVSTVQDENDCDINAQPAYQEWTIPSLTHKQVSFYLSDETVRQYCADSSAVRASPGTPSTTVMNEVYGLIVEYSNTLMKAVNQAAVIQMSTKFGENATNQDDGGTLINFNTNGSSNILNNGIIQMMRDIQENEFCGEPCMVGGGLWSAANMQQALQCCNAAGVNYAGAPLPKFFYDKDTQNLWGANSAGLFAPGSVKFISWDKYVTPAFAGQRGNSFFTNFSLPVNEFGCNLDQCLADLKIDMQLRYIDCPGSYTINGTPTTLDRGWQVILSKDFALWVQPKTGFAAGDSLEDTNGTIKYFATNSAYTGGSYSLY